MINYLVFHLVQRKEKERKSRGEEQTFFRKSSDKSVGIFFLAVMYAL